jgi:16S rRNA (cytosine967-C5)-methyltransferase
MADVRKIAFDTLYRVLFEDAYSAIALNHAVQENSLSTLDASFLSALVYGVLERKLTLEYIIRQYTEIRIKKIEKKTRIVLCLGMYQLIYMDKVPDSAAVDESVKLCKKLKLYKSAGFVNAVLRSFIRNDKAYRLPDEKDRVMSLSVCYSCPESIVSMWLGRYGGELCEQILAGMIGRPPVTVRVNTLRVSRAELIKKLSDRGVDAEVVPFLPDALNLSGTGSLDKIPEFRDGLFYVQDAASQFCCEMLGAQPGETICDVCSAPGGKSFYSAIRMENRGEVFSYDIHEHKLRLIQQTAKRLGIEIIRTAVRDASDRDADLPDCARILCDVPCSGLGILRRKPEIRYKTDTNIDILSNLQYSILCASAEQLPNGGVLVYSTCTLNDRENGDIVARFLSEHGDFVPDPLALPEGIERLIDEPAHCLTLFPGVYHTDGFFIARMRKAEKR